jgi:hypothetical protein
MQSRLKIVVLGIMGRTPYAGVAWQVLHYLEGLRRLGHEVFYLEDTGSWPYDADRNTVTSDCDFTLRYIAGLMTWCGLADRWAYRSAVDEQLFGASDSQVARVLASADALINLTGATVLRADHLQVPTRIYLETDPVLPQVEVANGRAFTLELLNAHTHHFTFGENLGAPDCGVPVGDIRYRPTRQPIVLDWWLGEDDDDLPSVWCPFTTVANWQQSGKDVEWNGETFAWSKHHEFIKFVDLPRRAEQQRFELALACGDGNAVHLLTESGWQVIDAIPLSRHILPYRSYIVGSRGEFTVAKDQNIRLRSGWFSDRSACYLAAGRPVITQDTAFDAVLPTGRGLFSFRTLPDILDALDRINSDYPAHASAAREIAAEYFGAEQVLTCLLEDAGL